jgi:hypothetical protein
MNFVLTEDSVFKNNECSRRIDFYGFMNDFAMVEASFSSKRHAFFPLLTSFSKTSLIVAITLLSSLSRETNQQYWISTIYSHRSSSRRLARVSAWTGRTQQTRSSQCLGLEEGPGWSTDMPATSVHAFAGNINHGHSERREKRKQECG